ncbi:beta-lactamase family protein [Gammaproteobacteria bacterium]|nr:beta-lactamase family protein [Gammaproteobacteria bacterium]
MLTKLYLENTISNILLFTKFISANSKRLLAPCLLLLTACGGGSGSSSNNPGQTDNNPPSVPPISPVQCSRNDIGSELNVLLETIETDTDFSFYIENSLGNAYSFNRGNSTLDTLYKSASTSKWVSAAAILRLVDNGVLQLSDTPQTYLSTAQWPLNASDSLYNITLSSLLSFTSGLINNDSCSNSLAADFFECVTNIAIQNADNTEVPGEQFYYGSNHLQVAGAMAIVAGGYADWEALFNEFKSQTGLFANSSYNLPSTNNPRLAGGMSWTGNDYINFIRSYKNAYIFSSTYMFDIATTDQIATASIENSPALSGIEEDWHYGYGLWIECHLPEFTSTACIPAKSVSSPGAYGAYPFLNIDKDYFGIIARQGKLGTFRNGYLLFDSVQGKVDEWASCPNA